MSFKNIPRVGHQTAPALLDARPAVPASAPSDVIGKISAFNYSVLAPENAEIARRAVADIRRSQKSAIIGIGRAFLSVKAVLEHGAFSAWLESEFAMSQRTAENYMSASRFVEGKNENISILPATAIYALADPNADQQVVADILAEVENGVVIPAKVVRERLNAKAQARRDLEAEVRKSPEQLAKEKEAALRRRKALQDENERWRRERAARAAEALEVAMFLFEKLGPADIAVLVKKMKGLHWHGVEKFFLPERPFGDAVGDATAETVAENFRANEGPTGDLKNGVLA